MRIFGLICLAPIRLKNMKDKIFALLTASFSGVRRDGLSSLARSLALQAETDDQAKALVDRLTVAQVEEYVKEFRSEVDREVSESNRSYENNLKKKFDFVAKGEKQAPVSGADADAAATGGGASDDLSAMVKRAIAEAVGPLQTELERYKAGDVAKTRLQTLTERLNGCKDEVFKAKALKDFSRMQFDSEEAFAEYLTDTEADIATANQHLADWSLAAQGRPLFAQKNEQGVSSGVSQYLASQKSESDVLSGKEV